MKQGRNSAHGVVKGLATRASSTTTVSGAPRKLQSTKAVTLPSLESARKITGDKPRRIGKCECGGTVYEGGGTWCNRCTPVVTVKV